MTQTKGQPMMEMIILARVNLLVRGIWLQVLPTYDDFDGI
jgi:hypothetical protein